MASPVDSARSTSSTAVGNTAHTINVGSPSAGTLLVVAIRFAGPQGTITFTGYTNFASDSSDASDDSTQIYWRWADGAEGASDPLTTSNPIKLAGITWLVTGAMNEQPGISTVAIGTTTANTANPGSAAPPGAPQDALYLAFAGGDGEVGAYTAAPTNYVNFQAANSGTASTAPTNCFIGGASRQISASSSDDPGVFTHGAHNAAWTAFTVAIRPPPPVVMPVLIYPTFGSERP